MILYVNGDSHSAAAEAVNTYAFAEDDIRYPQLKRKPHPDNLRVSCGHVLADILKFAFQTDAESASSNARIMRTTKEWIESRSESIKPEDVLMVIQWSTWEREEWLIGDEYYQVNASGIDAVPEGYETKYKEWVVGINWEQKTKQAYQDIIEFHEYLNQHGFKHLFFNGNSTFYDIPEEERYDFGNAYFSPYLPEHSFDGWLQAQGYNTVPVSNYHYGTEAHLAWARHLAKHIKEGIL